MGRGLERERDGKTNTTGAHFHSISKNHILHERSQFGRHISIPDLHLGFQSPFANDLAPSASMSA